MKRMSSKIELGKKDSVNIHSSNILNMTIILFFILLRGFLRLHRLQTLLHTVASKIGGSPAIFVPDLRGSLVFGDSRYCSAIILTFSHLGHVVVILHLDIIKDCRVILKSSPSASVPCELRCFFKHRIHRSLCTIEKTKAIVSSLFVGCCYVVHVGVNKFIVHAREG